ncbi:hypothetical protein CRENBAI_013806 [Crenichthys baileyi]|uniref:Uncharacterized protein n=1 Tax=Crenichthys baileyi TaxID=28760 RepID=A0AAV9SJV9_9TELE
MYGLTWKLKNPIFMFPVKIVSANSIRTDRLPNLSPLTVFDSLFNKFTFAPAMFLFILSKASSSGLLKTTPQTDLFLFYHYLCTQGEAVERVDSIKFLGIHISCDLSWTLNTSHLVKQDPQPSQEAERNWTLYSAGHKPLPGHN